MTGRVLLGFLSKRNYSSVHAKNFWGSFSHRSYSTAQKILELTPEKIPMTELECEIHNSKVPTYEQIKNSPELQEKLAKMYEEYAADPDFQQITIESMRWGRRSLGKEKH